MTTPTEKMAADLDAWALDAEQHKTEMVPVHRNTLRSAAALLRSQQPGQDEREPDPHHLASLLEMAPGMEPLLQRLNVNEQAALLCAAREVWQAARLSAPQAAGQWIFVHERLPKINTEVLIALEGQSIAATGQYTGKKHDVDGWCYPQENRNSADDGTDPKVIAWQPLPPTPAGEGG